MTEFEKRKHYAHFPNFYFKTLTIAAMNFKRSMNILPSSYYPGCKSRALPISAVGGASAASMSFEKCSFMPNFGGSPLRTGGLLRLLTLDLRSRRPKLLTNPKSEAHGSHCFEMVVSEK